MIININIENDNVVNAINWRTPEGDLVPPQVLTQGHLGDDVSPFPGTEMVVLPGETTELDDILHVFLTALHGAGFTYIKALGAENREGDITWTE